MIENYYNNSTLPDGEMYTSVEVSAPSLVCFRRLPFAFNCFEVQREISGKDVRIFVNDELGRQACKSLITAVRDYAMSQAEVWTKAQLEAVANTQTIFIVYNSDSDVRLDFSKEVLTIEQIQEANEGAEVWVSYDISDVGLITLVNELLNWL